MDISNMLKAISNGNHVFNETVQMYRNTKSDCPTCTYDPVRKESTDPYCQTCGGTGVIITYNSYQIPASVETSEDFKYDYTKAGKFVKGSIYLTIDSKEITTVLNTGNSAYNLNDYNQLRTFVESFDYVMWNNARYNINDFEPGVLQGNLYEIGCMLSLMD